MPSTRQTRLLLTTLVLITTITPATGISAAVSSDPEPAPIIERKLDYYDFTYRTPDGQPFNLREFSADKKLVIVAYVAGWCENSNRNGHILKGLHDKYAARGLGVVVVAEYSDAQEIHAHIDRVGIDYPLVSEETSRDRRKKSLHYKYRHQVGDKRKWGTPFYVFIDRADIQPSQPGSPLARRVFTVSGEMVEQDADNFVGTRLP
jgi:glutathione peroxidase-family protein